MLYIRQMGILLLSYWKAIDMLSKLKCCYPLRLFESGIGVLLPAFYMGSSWS